MQNNGVFVAGLLFCISFLNYMNRYTTPPVVGRLKTAFGVGDTGLSSVQSCFEIAYVMSSPIFGYLGDRLSRRHIVATTLIITALIGLGSSFIPETSFLLLLTTRALLGIGEACSTNICPSIIGDLFVDRKRTLVLIVYQLGIPFGCGVGFMFSGVVADFADDWRWAFRVTPLPIFISAILLLMFFRDPERGEAEQATKLLLQNEAKNDLAYLMRIPSYVLVSLANVGAAFATGSLTFWAPDLILRMLAMKGHNRQHSEAEIGSIFGAITIASGITGILVGSFASSICLKPYAGPSADGIISGIAMFLAAPILFAGLVCIPVDEKATWFLIFFGISALSCCYVLLSEITLNVVIVTRRATARSYQSTLAHFFGDAASPWLSAMISDRVKEYQKMNGLDLNFFANVPIAVEDVGKIADFTSMQTSLYLSTLIVAASGGLFLCSSFFINEDAAKTKTSSPATNNLPLLIGDDNDDDDKAFCSLPSTKSTSLSNSYRKKRKSNAGGEE